MNLEKEKYIKDFAKIRDGNSLLCDYSMLPSFYQNHKSDVRAKLYKYLPMTCEYYWKTLFDKQAWFSFALRDMANFEDKDDSALIYDIENLDDIKKIEKSSHHLEDAQKILNELKSVVESKIQDKKKISSCQLKDWQRYSYELAMNNCENDLVKLNGALLQLTNESDYIQVIKDVYRDLMSRHLETELKRIGILSLTTSFQNEYMWKQYAANHSGVCLEYETAKIPIPVLPILYKANNQASLTKLFGTGEITLATLNENAFIRFLIKDKKKYAREHEWRGLAAVDKCKNFSQQPLKGFEVDDFKPCKIYIGEKMNEADIARLKDFCKRKHIRFEIYHNKRCR